MSAVEIDARLPLVVGLAADYGVTAETAHRAERPIAEILADLCGRYRATPLLLLVQAPEALQRSAEQLAANLDAVIANLENHVAAVSNPPGGEDATRRAAFLAEHCHLAIAISDRWETAPGDLAGQVIQFRLQGVPDRHSSRPLQLDSGGQGGVYHVVAGKDDADATKWSDIDVSAAADRDRVRQARIG